MSALQVFQNISSARRPGKEVIEVEDVQVWWVSDGWNDFLWLIPTSHCRDATRESVLQIENEKRTPTELAAAGAPPLRWSQGHPHFQKEEFVLNYAFSKKRGLPGWEMGILLNSINCITCHVARTVGNQLPHSELCHDLPKFGLQMDLGLLAFVLLTCSCHVSV